MKNLIWILCLGGIIAAGGCTPTVEDDPNATTTTGGDQVELDPGPVDEVELEGQTMLEIMSENEDMTGTDWTRARESAARFSTDGNHLMTIYVSEDNIREVDFLPDTPDLPKDTAALVLRLARSDMEEVIDTGKYMYSADEAADMRFTALLTIPGQDSAMITEEATGTVDITSMTSDRVAGTFTIEDSTTKITGSFNAEIVDI